MNNGIPNAIEFRFFIAFIFSYFKLSEKNESLFSNKKNNYYYFGFKSAPKTSGLNSAK